MQQFYDLVVTVEDGFEFVAHSYEEGVSTPVTDRVLLDILSSFEQFSTAIPQLVDLIEDDEQTTNALYAFNEVLELLVKLEEDTKGKEQRLAEIYARLAPMYITWKQQVELQLKPYLVQ